MKKYILLIIPLFFWGCQKDYNTIVDPQPVAYQVISMSNAATFSYSPSDSLYIIRISLENSSDVSSVTCDIFGPDNSLVNSAPIVLTPEKTFPTAPIILNPEKTFPVGTYQEFNLFNTFPMSQYYPSGTYQINYYVTDINGNTAIAGIYSFQYNNG
ncbi:MAG TPA: hypothetical protein VMV36_08200, partial [Ignavibacteriaceae bacterium]|nr:hypothetical protein [Ignavibacteriaceae bacterium]